MYEKVFGRNLGKLKVYAGISLCVDLLGCYFGCNVGDLLLYLLSSVYPIIDGNGPFCVLFYLISQFQTWHVTLSQYVMKGGRANAEFLCYTALFFVIVIHPFCKSVHAVLFLYFFFWTKIRYSDTMAIITNCSSKNNKNSEKPRKALTSVDQHATIVNYIKQPGGL